MIAEQCQIELRRRFECLDVRIYPEARTQTSFHTLLTYNSRGLNGLILDISVFVFDLNRILEWFFYKLRGERSYTEFVFHVIEY